MIVWRSVTFVTLVPISGARIAVFDYILLCLRVVADAEVAVTVEQVDPRIGPRTPNKDYIVLLDLAHT